MRLPSLLAGIGLLVCLYYLTKRQFDERVAFYAVLACIASHHFSKLTWFADQHAMDSPVVPVDPRTSGAAFDVAETLDRRALNGLNVLAKGPIGPVLFCIFLCCGE